MAGSLKFMVLKDPVPESVVMELGARFCKAIFKLLKER
jgi:hypothetical protein